MSDTIPSDSHIVGDSGHVGDHNNISDMLGLYAQVLARMAGTYSATNSTNVTAVSTLNTAENAFNTKYIVLPSGDTTGVTDLANINAAITSVGGTAFGGVVELVAGNYYIRGPILINVDGLWLRGCGGNAINGNTSNSPNGTIINHGSSSWNGPITTYDSASANAMIVAEAPSTSGSRYQIHISDMTLFGNSSFSPANVDGIQIYGLSTGTRLNNLSIVYASRYGIAFITDTASNDSDGIWADRIMLQHIGSHAFYRPPSDSNIHNLHVQYAGDVDNVGCGYFTDPTSGGNCALIGLRMDLCAGDGYLLDHQGSFGDATKMVGCSTERNCGHGLHITNSSATGATVRAPVVVAGCHFEGDGRGQTFSGGNGSQNSTNAGGAFGGILIEGWNIVSLAATDVVCSSVDVTAGAPRYSLYLNQVGSGNTQPHIVQWDNGFASYSTTQSGGEWLHNPNESDVLSFGPGLTVLAGIWNQGGALTSRYGTATLSSGSVNVTNSQCMGRSLIFLSYQSTSGTTGRLSVASVAKGSFTINSSSGADNSTVGYWIL